MVTFLPWDLVNIKSNHSNFAQVDSSFLCFLLKRFLPASEAPAATESVSEWVEFIILVNHFEDMSFQTSLAVVLARKNTAKINQTNTKTETTTISYLHIMHTQKYGTN